MIFTIDRIEGKTVYAELKDLEIIKLPIELFIAPKEGKSYEIKEIKNTNDTTQLLKEVFND